MNIEKRSARFGAAILIFSILLRLVGGMVSPQAKAVGILDVARDYFWDRHPTGGVSMVSRPTTVPPTTENTIPTAPTMPVVPAVPIVPTGLTFLPTHIQYTALQYGYDCGYRADPAALLQRPLNWKLLDDAPTVLIFHSHATESYTRQEGEDYLSDGDYRTQNTDHNMVAVGALLAQQLRDRGIGVIHDRQLHDYPSYSMAYTNARASVERYLQEYPSICLVLDLHRDAALNPDGSQFATSATVNGIASAQLMLVAGTDWTGGSHPNWEENLSLAMKLQVLLEQKNPGLTRPNLLRGCVFNQDLLAGMLIVEVGTAGNSLAEALTAMPPLADAIAILSAGANLKC
jgi:stage II sporulation protein P